MNARVFCIIRKEFIHIIRDPRSLTIIIIMPIIMILMFGYAFNSDLKNVKLGILDYSRSPQSRKYIEKFTCTEYFKIQQYCNSLAEIEIGIKNREIQVALVIPRDFAQSLQTRFTTPIQAIIDGSDAQSATIIQNYIDLISLDASTEFSESQLQMPLDIRVSIWYNPELETVNFFVPGIIALILVMISALLTSIAIAKEKESGTMEQILVSPIKANEIVIGKVLPYIGLAFLDGLLIILVGVFWFKVPFRGSILLLLLLSIVYIFSAISFGLLISTIAPSLRVAMLVTLATTIMPTILLSGFIFPIESMPLALQYVSTLIPARYFLVIARAVFLKGIGIRLLWPQAGALFFMGTLFLLISAKRFKSRLE
jgi:ABC-2 type transport system permease protein